MPAFGAAVAAWATLGHINLKSTPLGSRHLLLLVFRIQYRRTFLEMNRSLPNLAFALLPVEIHSGSYILDTDL
jgi:hypothetical protein